MSLQILLKAVIARWLPMSLPPHEFVQISRNFISCTSLHSPQFPFNSTPVRLYILSVSSWRCHKFNRVVYCAVGGYIWQESYVSICCPLITPDNWSRCHMVQYNWQKSSLISLGYNLHESKGRWMWSVTYSKNPHLITCSMTSMIINVNFIAVSDSIILVPLICVEQGFIILAHNYWNWKNTPLSAICRHRMMYSCPPLPPVLHLWLDIP